MKILMTSYAYAPGIGGIETASFLLASEWLRQGHCVTIVTETPASGTEEQQDQEKPRVIRQPGWRTLLHWFQWADVIFQNNISLRLARVIICTWKPVVITSQTWLDHGSRGGEFLKRMALRFARRVYISNALANHARLPGEVIPNPYDDSVFKILPAIPRRPDLVFVGRLVSDKGIDLLLDALARLRASDLRPCLTIVGCGPAEGDLRRQAQELGLSDQVAFVGMRRGVELAELLNGHEIAIVPSRWAEPFGIVAVEAIACGCVVVGSEAGGLPEAIGRCGILFPNGDTLALVGALQRVLTDQDLRKSVRDSAAAHLERFNLVTVAQRYLRILEEATQ
jgi:glycosyltransferase involved in cell wall biosynthesis